MSSNCIADCLDFLAKVGCDLDVMFLFYNPDIKSRTIWRVGMGHSGLQQVSMGSSGLTDKTMLG